MQTLEAIVDKAGHVRLLTEITLPEDRRVLLTILDENLHDSPEIRKKKLFAALEQLAKSNPFPEIKDPVDWQRKLRDEWD